MQIFRLGRRRDRDVARNPQPNTHTNQSLRLAMGLWSNVLAGLPRLIPHGTAVIAQAVGQARDNFPGSNCIILTVPRGVKARRW